MKELATLLLKSLSSTPENVVVEEKVEQIRETLFTNGKICNNNIVEISQERKTFDIEDVKELSP